MKKRRGEEMNAFYMSMTFEELAVIDRYAALLNAQVGEKKFYDRNLSIRHGIRHLIKPKVEVAEKMLQQKSQGVENT